VFGAHGMGQGTSLRNLTRLDVLRAGADMAINRRSKLSLLLRGRRLTFGLMVQPEHVFTTRWSANWVREENSVRCAAWR